MKSTPSLSVGTFEAKNKLSALVDLAAKGQKIWITKRGKRVALLSSGVEQTQCPAGEVMATLAAIRTRTKRGEGSLKSLIAEGQR